MTDIYYKAVRLDGTSHYDQKTLWVPGREIIVENAPNNGESCGIGIHGCKTILSAVSYQKGPSDYLIFEPTSIILGKDDIKSRFSSVLPIRYLGQEEIDDLAGMKLYEANHPFNPLEAQTVLTIEEITQLVIQWDSVRVSVRYSVRVSVWNSVWNSVWDSVWNSVRDSVWNSVRFSVRDSVWDSVWDSVTGYFGSLFPIKTWKHTTIEHPWESVSQLWYAGYVPLYYDNTWKVLKNGKLISIDTKR